MNSIMNLIGKITLLGSLLACSLAASLVITSFAWGKDAAPSVPEPHQRITSPFRPVSVTSSAKSYYQSVWGVDNLLVRLTSSSSLVRFSYRVTDPARAKPLGDDHATPYMFNPRTHALLHIPVLENVGKLRQADENDDLKAGKEYWMTFSNKGNFVKTGDRVNVIIGNFHADGLLVE